jgi:hypothetical protein
MNSLESVWKHREEILFPRLFGQRRNGIYVLGAAIFSENFGQDRHRWADRKAQGSGDIPGDRSQARLGGVITRSIHPDPVVDKIS